MTSEYHRIGTREGVAERLSSSDCPRCKALGDADTGVPKSCRASRSAMPMLSVPTPLLFWTLLLATLGCSAARVADNDPRNFAALALHQAGNSEPYPFFRQNADDPYVSAVNKDIAMVAEILQSVEENRSEEVAEDPPLPIPQALHSDPSKRVGYMSLCHFKICNMGRKRNPFRL